jgi:ethanolamine-phosphate phospho-lyase
VVCKRELADSFASSGIEYFNTYGGNSVACCIAEAVLDTIVDENLQANALMISKYLRKKLKILTQNFKWVGEVKGLGLFMGIEIIHAKDDPADIEPYPQLAKFIVDYLRCNNIVVSRNINVVKIKPPLVFSVENADTLISGLNAALEHAVKSGKF